MHTSSKLNCSERHCICFFMKQKLGNRYNSFQEIAGSTFLAMNLLRKTNDSSLAFSTPTVLEGSVPVSLCPFLLLGAPANQEKLRKPRIPNICDAPHTSTTSGAGASAGLIPPSERKGAALIQTPRRAVATSSGAAKGREPSVVARSEPVHRPVPGTTTPLQASS